jgi:hypothetical protein
MEPTRNFDPALSVPQPPATGVLKVNRRTPSASLNAKILKAINRALRENPEANLLSQFPPSYTQRLKQLSSTSMLKPLILQIYIA